MNPLLIRCMLVSVVGFCYLASELFAESSVDSGSSFVPQSPGRDVQEHSKRVVHPISSGLLHQAAGDSSKLLFLCGFAFCGLAAFARLAVARVVRLARRPKPVQEHRELAGHGHHGPAFGVLPPSFGHLQAKAPQVTVRAKRAQDVPVSYTHLRAHETVLDLVCRLLLEKKNTKPHTLDTNL